MAVNSRQRREMRPFCCRHKGIAFDGDADDNDGLVFFSGETRLVLKNGFGCYVLRRPPPPMFQRTCSLSVFPAPSLVAVFLVSQVGQGQPDRRAFPGPNRRAGTSQAVAREDELVLERRHGTSRLGGIINCHEALYKMHPRFIGDKLLDIT